MTYYPESEYCTFMWPDGRKCRTLKMPTRNVCLGHWRHDGQFEQDETALLELAAATRTLDSRRGVRKAIASFLRLIALDRIPPRKAAMLLYGGQLMLMSFQGGQQEAEAIAASAKELVEARLPDGQANDELLPVGPLVPVHSGSNGSNGAGGSNGSGPANSD